MINIEIFEDGVYDRLKGIPPLGIEKRILMLGYRGGVIRKI